MTWEERERARLRDWIENDTHEGPLGELRWDSNDAPVPMDTFERAGIEPPLSQAVARDRYVDESIEAYRKARANMTPEERAEEMAEARAAMGPGVEMVNILTGERYTT